MKQIAKNLTDCEDGCLLGKTHLIVDRDTRFSEAFGSILQQEGIVSVSTASASIAKFERLHGAVHAKHQARMSESDDLLW